MWKPAVLILCATTLALPTVDRAGVSDIRGGGEIVRTWSVGFWESNVGSFDTLQLEWVSGQVLSPPYLMNFDIDGSYGVPYGPDGWKVLSGGPQGAIVVCANPADWLGFDIQLVAPVGPTCWQVRTYDGTVLKDIVLVTFDGRSWGFDPLGGCCNTDGTCALMSEPECRTGQGAWLGAAAECSVAGCQQTPASGMSWGQVKTLYR
jgi:hypothetical protein